jgi:glycosyltransferase involved in cell wall biosynthesis
MVLLSHPTGNANSRQALLALHERNMLAGFYTTVAWDGESAWNRLLPPKIGRELNRRAYPEIPKRLIHTSPARELFRVLCARFGMKALVEENGSMFSVSGIYSHFDRLVAEAVYSRPPRVVYAYDGGALQTFRAARRMGVKTIYELPTAHTRFKREFFREEAELQPAFAGTFQNALADPEWLDRKDEELELADQVIVPSSYVLSTLPANIPAARVRVIPYGAPAVLAEGGRSRGKRDGKLRVLYVGTLSQGKGLSYLLEAIKKVESAVEFTMIGTRVGECGPLDAALQRYRWTSTVPHSAVLEAMSQHDVLAFPTLSEGLALVVLEAMSRGMTVITTANSGCLGIIRDGKEGFIIPIRSAEALAEKLELLAGNRDLLDAMSEAALNRARKYTWQSYRESLASMVKEVLNAVKDASCA